MQLVSDDDVGKRLLEQTRFELAAKGVFRLVGFVLKDYITSFEISQPSQAFSSRHYLINSSKHKIKIPRIHLRITMAKRWCDGLMVTSELR